MAKAPLKGSVPLISNLEKSVQPISSAPDIDSKQNELPKHVAIIMDGNNRWAKQRGLQGVEGHKAGAKTVRNAVETFAKSGVEAFTVFAFSSENWRRPEDEVQGLMGLFLDALHDEVPDLHKNGIRLQFIGDLSAFNEELRQRMKEAEALTANNPQMVFSVAVNYGGRWDIVNTAKQLAAEVANGQLQLDEINEAAFNQRISLGDLPPLDLCIRTGGEYRISNFLLWQVAYAELYFSELLWPDFDEKAIHQALSDYAQRQRRFGRTSEQVEAATLEQNNS